jgi:transposase
VVQGSNGLSRGDAGRNARLAVLRGVLPVGHAILGIDLAQSRQAAVLTDHDSRVLARWRPRCPVWQLGAVLDEARVAAAGAGFAGVTVACEPTGHRWMVIQQLAAGRGVPLVCVQPLVVARSREVEDYTRGKNDDRDAVLIARQAAQLHCYLPERTGPGWARLRHLGTRRGQLITASSACVQRIQDLLELAWPAVLDTAADPLRSATWLACVRVALAAGDGDLDAVHARGRDTFLDAARAGLPAWGATRLCRRIAVAVHAALTEGTGVHVQRPGALERARDTLRDWQTVRDEIAAVDAAMLDILDQVGVLEVAGTIRGVSAISVAAILAETGDPARFATARAIVKHAGLAPADNASGNRTGSARISRRGRPALRLAAWRAVWGALRHNPVYAARHAHLTGRTTDPLTTQQANTAIAAALLRQIHAITTTRTPWNPDIAAGRRRPNPHHTTTQHTTSQHTTGQEATQAA